MTDELHEPTLDRTIPASPEAVYRCWIEAELMKRWFAAAPFTVADATIEPWPGGTHAVTTRGPDGTDYANAGVVLEAEPGRRLVVSDAFAAGWVPAAAPFMVAVIDLAPHDGGTRYRVGVRHVSADGLRRHEEMGFHADLGAMTDQLAEVAARL